MIKKKLEIGISFICYGIFIIIILVITFHQSWSFENNNNDDDDDEMFAERGRGREWNGHEKKLNTHRHTVVLNVFVFHSIIIRFWLSRTLKNFFFLQKIHFFSHWSYVCNNYYHHHHCCCLFVWVVNTITIIINSLVDF